MINAAKARELAGPTVDETLEEVGKLIEEAAKNGQRLLRLYDPSDLWVNGGYDKSPNWKEAKTKLEALGYTVEFFYELRQFVNMYTIIKW